MFKFGKRSRSKLHGVHSDLILVASRALLYTTIDFAITEGKRDRMRQSQLVAAGFSQTMYSKHIPQVDGFAHAVDVMAVGDINHDALVDHQDKGLTWSRDTYVEISTAWKRAADELGVKIRWGGDFKSFFDGPHFELL